MMFINVAEQRVMDHSPCIGPAELWVVLVPMLEAPGLWASSHCCPQPAHTAHTSCRRPAPAEHTHTHTKTFSIKKGKKTSIQFPQGHKQTPTQHLSCFIKKSFRVRGGSAWKVRMTQTIHTCENLTVSHEMSVILKFSLCTWELCPISKFRCYSLVWDSRNILLRK